MNQNLWILFLLGLIALTLSNGILNLLGEYLSQFLQVTDNQVTENFSSYCNPYQENKMPWFYRFLNFPYLRPAYYRNYGEVRDPYFPGYYQTYYNDLPYYYYSRNNFDRYRKVWGQNKHDQKRCKKHLKLVPGAKCNSRKR